MSTEVNAGLELDPIVGEGATIEAWTNSFHLALVAVDPFTFESAWILDQAGEVLRGFAGADCRTGWVVAGNEANAKQFLGPWAEEFLTFADPDREIIAAFDLDVLPAFVMINGDHEVEATAEGWDVDEWQDVADRLASIMSWSAPVIARMGGPAPFEGSAAAG